MTISTLEDMIAKKKRMESLYGFISYITWEGDKLDKRILPKLNKELTEIEKLFYNKEDTLTEDLIFNVR